MINIGKPAAEMQLINKAFSEDHSLRVTATLMDLNENRLQDLTWRLYDGQVNIAAQSEISRVSTIVLYDPDYSLGLDRSDPSAGALYYDRMVSVVFEISKYEWLEPVAIPVFRGPISNLKRKGPLVTIDCVGKEFLSQNVIWNPQNYVKGANKSSVIRHLMDNHSGERKFDLQRTTAKLPAPLSLVRESMIWSEAIKVAASMSMYMFYDGRGVLRMRPYPTASSFAYEDGPGGSILEDPDNTFDMSGTKNVIWVVGGAPKGSKRIASAMTMLPYDNALNHYKIGRTSSDGTAAPRVLLEKIEDTNITANSAAKRRSDTRMNTAMQQALDFQVPVMSVPTLEEGDVVTAKINDRYAINFRMNDSSFPFFGSAGTLGVNKQLKAKKR